MDDWIDDRGQRADFLNPYPNLTTRARLLMAETRDLKEWRAE